MVSDAGHRDLTGNTMEDTQLRMLRLGKKGYTCSQIILLMGLELRAETNPGLVRAMAGLAYGCGSGQGTCGVLTGGCCLLALYAGKGSDEERPSERLTLMLQELTDWFVERAGCDESRISCEAIVGEAGPAASRQRCGAIVADTYAKVMEILVANAIDPMGP
jgi:Putative redox-active protein (C_GCAxxG_C_C)